MLPVTTKSLANQPTLMKNHSRLPLRPWMVLVGVVVLIAGHGIIVYYVSSHVALSVTVMAGLTLLVVIKHLGLLGPLYALFRRRSRRNDR